MKNSSIDNPELSPATKTKTYACKQCGKTFSQNGNLKTHMRLHNGQLFSCSICPKEFNTVQNLDFHVITKHTLLKCDQCDYETAIFAF